MFLKGKKMNNSSSLVKTKNSSIELLRIISMVFIVISHYSLHGQLEPNEMGFGINRLILSMTNIGHLGVDIFILYPAIL